MKIFRIKLNVNDQERRKNYKNKIKEKKKQFIVRKNK